MEELTDSLMEEQKSEWNNLSLMKNLRPDGRTKSLMEEQKA